MHKLVIFSNEPHSRIAVTENLATIFIIGNEPDAEGAPNPQDYADAFNFLYQSNASDIQAIETQQGIDIQILAAGSSGFHTTVWFSQMTQALQGVDGFAIHTYGRLDGSATQCRDPQTWCGGDPNQDGSFRYYRSLINRMDPRWYDRPVYITETNTDSDGREHPPNPNTNYDINWINRAFADVRDYNATRGVQPEVRAVCWFVDRDPAAGTTETWEDFALSNLNSPTLKHADDDMSAEFRLRANIFN